MPVPVLPAKPPEPQEPQEPQDDRSNGACAAAHFLRSWWVKRDYNGEILGGGISVDPPLPSRDPTVSEEVWMLFPTRQVDIGFSNDRLAAAGHICLIYESDGTREKVVAEFMAAGLRNHESVRYLSDRTPPEQVRSWITGADLSVDEAEKSGAFAVLRAEDAYCPSGVFDPHAMIDRLKGRYKQVAQAGYHGTRSCGEMGWLFKGIPGSERWLEYESLLNTAFDPFPHSGMCQYDARLFDGATLFKVLQLHPQIIAHGQIVKNPFFLRPDEFAANQET